MDKLVPIDSQLPIPYGVELTRTSLTIPEDLSFVDWEGLGATLREIEKSVQWWLGDWLNFGEYRYGEMYAQVLDETDYKEGTLKNAKWVTSRVEKSRRRDNLKFSHHQEVAPLELGEQDEWLDRAMLGDPDKKGPWTVKKLRTEIRKAKFNENKNRGSGPQPIICKSDALEFLDTFEPLSVDLLITDPPYMTDMPDGMEISDFVMWWVAQALGKVKDSGRAYIFIGPYYEEVWSYLDNIRPQNRLELDDPLVWTYRNTLGPSPKYTYKNNHQFILHLYGKDAPPLNCPEMVEQFSVQDVNAPDGRLGDRYHTWQKPDELAEGLIRHSTKPGDTVID